MQPPNLINREDLIFASGSCLRAGAIGRLLSNARPSSPNAAGSQRRLGTRPRSQRATRPRSASSGIRRSPGDVLRRQKDRVLLESDLDWVFDAAMSSQKKVKCSCLKRPNLIGVHYEQTTTSGAVSLAANQGGNREAILCGNSGGFDCGVTRCGHTGVWRSASASAQS